MQVPLRLIRGTGHPLPFISGSFLFIASSILLWLAVSLSGCLSTGEPKVITAYTFVNDSPDTVEILSDCLRPEALTDSLIYRYVVPDPKIPEKFRHQKERVRVAPHSRYDVSSVEYFQSVVKKEALFLILIDPERTDTIGEFRPGLAREVLLAMIRLDPDSLRINGFEVHYKP